MDHGHNNAGAMTYIRQYTKLEQRHSHTQRFVQNSCKHGHDFWKERRDMVKERGIDEHLFPALVDADSPANFLLNLQPWLQAVFAGLEKYKQAVNDLTSCSLLICTSAERRLKDQKNTCFSRNYHTTNTTKTKQSRILEMRTKHILCGEPFFHRPAIL